MPTVFKHDCYSSPHDVYEMRVGNGGDKEGRGFINFKLLYWTERSTKVLQKSGLMPLKGILLSSHRALSGIPS